MEAAEEQTAEQTKWPDVGLNAAGGRWTGGRTDGQLLHSDSDLLTRERKKKA